MSLPRTGRPKGAPNKVTAVIRKAIAGALENYMGSEDFYNDLANLDPKDRIAAMEKFAAYVIPKMQSTTIDINDGTTTGPTIEDRLVALSRAAGDITAPNADAPTGATTPNEQPPTNTQ